MRDDKDHNERLDDFSGYMRQRLEEHRLPVDAGCWDEVEARMNRRARPRGWLWTGGLVGSPDKPGGLSIQLCKSEKKEFYIRYSS